MSITLTPKIRGFIGDFVRVGTIVAGILVVVLAAAKGLNVPAQYVVYVSVAAGALNGLIGIARPFATTAVKSIFRGGK